MGTKSFAVFLAVERHRKYEQQVFPELLRNIHDLPGNALIKMAYIRHIHVDAERFETSRALCGEPDAHRTGDQQIVARIACDEVDMLLFFRDPICAKPSEPNEMNLLRICDVHNIPVATNIATAEVLIHGLEHGDLDWRTILNPQH